MMFGMESSLKKRNSLNNSRLSTDPNLYVKLCACIVFEVEYSLYILLYAVLTALLR